MKKVIWIILISLSVISAHSQVTEARLKQVLDSFANTLPAEYIKNAGTTTGMNNLNLDTLTCPINTSASYLIWVEMTANNKDVGNGLKIVQIKNVNGIYSISNNFNIKPISGDISVNSAQWGMAKIINNYVIVVGTGQRNQTIAWVIKKTLL